MQDICNKKKLIDNESFEDNSIVESTQSIGNESIHSDIVSNFIESKQSSLNSNLYKNENIVDKIDSNQTIQTINTSNTNKIELIVSNELISTKKSSSDALVQEKNKEDKDQILISDSGNSTYDNADKSHGNEV